jgi:hypothetical protein
MVWGMWNGSRKDSRPGARRPARLSLECLERRDCPSPVITSFSAAPTNGPSSRQVELKGTVSDFHPEWDTVTFSGMAAGVAMPDVQGNFDVLTTGFGLGAVTAIATRYIEKSAPVISMITSAPPTITAFQVIQGPNGNWTFQGSVADEAPLGIVVKFSGNGQINGLTATVDCHGNFSATFFLPNLMSGFVTASCCDVWSLASNTVTDPLI